MLRCVLVLGILLINVVIGSNEKEASSEVWNGKWFPKKPGDPDPALEPSHYIRNLNGSGEWRGNWFPKQPGDPEPAAESHNEIPHGREGDEWRGKLFPKKAEDTFALTREGVSEGKSVKKQLTMGILDPVCDDAETNLWLDYDPKNLSHHSVFICTENRTLYKPSFQNRPKLLEYTIPYEYSAMHSCMNETITYTDNIPTFGTHRPNWPVYGEYDYCPVQRWLHSLEHGAIVLLYHPCANRQQTNKLRNLVKACMYRYVITAYEKLTIERPFALVAWGKSLEMSYIDSSVVIGFIRMNALQAPERISRDGQYNAGLVEKANIVSDLNDSNLCPNM